MNSLRTILVVAGLATAFTSCGSKPEEPAPKPVKKPPVVRRAPPAPVVDTNPTDMFRDDSGNVAMPSDDQLDEGKDSSIGTGQPVTNLNTGPSIAISPPSAPSPLTKFWVIISAR